MLSTKIQDLIGKIKCFLGFHTPSKYSYDLEILKQRKYEDATVVREYYTCDRCHKRLHPTGFEGTMYELMGHTKRWFP